MNSWRINNRDVIKNNLKGKRILVTGGAGFIGSQLVVALTQFDCQVEVLTRPSSDLWRLSHVFPLIKVHHVDFTQGTPQKLQKYFGDVDIMFHLAATGVDLSIENYVSLMHSNVLGTLNFLQLAKKCNVQRFIYCGSCFEYGSGNFLSETTLPKPLAEYGLSKATAWMLAHMFHRKYGLPVVSLRPFTVFGPFEGRSRLIPHVILSALDGRDIELTGGKQMRDFVFIDDVVDAFIAAGFVSGIIGETFNISTAKTVSVRKVVLTILRLMHSGARPLFGVKPYRSMEVWELSGDMSLAKARLGWEAVTSLEAGLQKTIDWLRKHRQDYPAYR